MKIKSLYYAIVVCLLILLCDSFSAFAQHWNFDQKDPLSDTKGKAMLIFSSRTNKPELVEGALGKGLRTDGYSHFISSQLQIGQTVRSVSGWFALESFPTDTAAFFALVDTTARESLSICVDRFGEIMLRKVNGVKPSYYPTGVWVEKFKWIQVMLAAQPKNPVLYINAKKINIPLANLLKRPQKILFGCDYWQNKLAQMDLTAINGIIDEFRVNYQNDIDVSLSNQVALVQKKTPRLAIPASRFEDDFSRPKYHLLPAANWTNETHGLIYYKGNYHIFNQKNASSLTLRQINWGHFSSPDLINWTEHKPALSPQKGYDQNGIWSGHVVLDNQGKPMISYTAGGEKMGIGLAFAKDDMLLQWDKYAKNPVIPGQPEGYSRTDLRDTYVWKENGNWYMVVGFGVKKDNVEKGALLLYRSADAKSWKFLHTLFEGNPAVDHSGIFWEMPVFKKIGDKYILLVNRVPERGIPARALYWTGNFIGERFIPDNPMPKNLEVINRLLSPSVAYDKDGNLCAIAIIPDEISSHAAYLKGWSHLYSIPRVWSLQGDAIVQLPHPSLKSLRSIDSTVVSMKMPAEGFKQVYGGHQQYELITEITPNGAGKFGLVLHKNVDGSEYTKIYYDVSTSEIVVDQTHSSKKSGIPLTTRRDRLDIDVNRPVKFHVFVDGSVVEVFINDRYAFTTRIFPQQKQSDIAEVFSQNGNANFKATVWSLKPAIMRANF